MKTPLAQVVGMRCDRNWSEIAQLLPPPPVHLNKSSENIWSAVLEVNVLRHSMCAVHQISDLVAEVAAISATPIVGMSSVLTILVAIA